jgi:hypothetical protein
VCLDVYADTLGMALRRFGGNGWRHQDMLIWSRETRQTVAGMGSSDGRALGAALVCTPRRTSPSLRLAISKKAAHQAAARVFAASPRRGARAIKASSACRRQINNIAYYLASANVDKKSAALSATDIGMAP